MIEKITNPSTTWTVEHNLGYIPLCEVSVIDDGALQVMLPLDITVTTTTVTATFSEVRTGEIRII